MYGLCAGNRTGKSTIGEHLLNASWSMEHAFGLVCILDLVATLSRFLSITFQFQHVLVLVENCIRVVQFCLLDTAFLACFVYDYGLAHARTPTA